MSGIDQRVIFAVTRIRAHFVDPIGNAFPPVVGTGFFLETLDAHNILVTNRHNLDPRSKLGNDTAYRLGRVEVELRAVASTSRPIVVGTSSEYVPARTIGMMSGHFEERVDDTPRCSATRGCPISRAPRPSSRSWQRRARSVSGVEPHSTESARQRPEVDVVRRGTFSGGRLH